MNWFLGIFAVMISVCLPVYFWGYILTILGKNSDDIRIKFWVGLISGVISVILMYFFGKISLKNYTEFMIWFGVFFSIFGIFLLILTHFGSKFSKKFLRSSAFGHCLLSAFLACIFVIFYGFGFFPVLIFSLILPALFEEIAKHFSLLGAIGRQFSFSLREIVLFCVSVTLGFALVENLVYAYSVDFNIVSMVSRLFGPLFVHLVSSLVLTLFWWHALSFRFLSWRYFLYFVLGIISATGLHFFANFAFSHGYIVVIFVYAAILYGLISWIFVSKNS